MSRTTIQRTSKPAKVMMLLGGWGLFLAFFWLIFHQDLGHHPGAPGLLLVSSLSLWLVGRFLKFWWND